MILAFIDTWPKAVVAIVAIVCTAAVLGALINNGKDDE